MDWFVVFLGVLALGWAIAALRQRPGFVRGAAWGMALGHLVAFVFLLAVGL